jgi:glycosyltransferase involved in cell wall biosynthesis
MRILMVSTYFHPIVSGAERQALALALALRERGHAVAVATCRFTGLAPFETVEGIPVHRVIRPLGSGAAYAATYLGSLLPFLVAHRSDFDLLHAHLLLLDAFAGGLVRVGFRTPVVAKAACGGTFGDVSRLRRIPMRSVFRIGLRRIDRIVATSEQVRSELLDYGFPPSRVARIPNGVDTGRFAPRHGRSELKTHLAPEGPLAVFVGRLDVQKGLECLLRAWARVRAEHPRARLVLIGEGPQAHALQELAGALGVQDEVLFAGAQRDVRPYLQAADVFVLPSLAEGMSNALLEAMACGVPCVTTRVGGNVDLVTDGETGLLVDPGQEEPLARALLTLLDDPEGAQRLGEAARRRIEQGYTMEAVTERYLALYEELLHGA